MEEILVVEFISTKDWAAPEFLLHFACDMTSPVFLNHLNVIISRINEQFQKFDRL